MVVVSYSGKEINAKLVYYGAGLSGKTTNLEAIYEAVPDTSRGKMVSMKTQSDRTLFFDLLPLDLGEIMGFKTRFLLYTVPGQVFYNATRKLVLKGADALVFVADSEVGKMEENKESLANLRTNLAEYGLTLDGIPWVLQYNKRDLPNVYSVEELNAELNPGRVPFFEAVASEGKGVFETFRGVSHLLMEKVTKDLRRSPGTSPRTNPASTVEEHSTLAHGPSSGRGEPAAPSRAAAPPQAPAQLIRTEAQSTRASAPDSQSMRIDYGTELELPRLPGGGVTSDAAAGEPAEGKRPTPGSKPSGVIKRPTSASTPASAKPSNAAVESSGAGAEESETRQIVVPVKLPPGGRYQIVIRLQIDNTD